MEYGYIRVKVEEMRLKKGISKNKLCHAAELERKQLVGKKTVKCLLQGGYCKS